jgi:hypothetical protein
MFATHHNHIDRRIAMKRFSRAVAVSAVATVLLSSGAFAAGGAAGDGGGSSGGSNGGSTNTSTTPEGTTSVGGGVGTGTGSSPAPLHKKSAKKKDVSGIGSDKTDQENQ